MVYFVEAFEGKGKTSGKDFQCITLMEVRKRKQDGKTVGRTVEFFTNEDARIDCSKLNCGDIVKTDFEESELLGGRPVLVGLESTGENVFANFVK